MSKMFGLVTCTYNPLGGPCHHCCQYCWAKMLIKRHKMKKYQEETRLIHKELKRKFKSDEFCFVQDMSDLFGEWVPTLFINTVLDHIREFPSTTFLLLTKNPKRYHEFEIPNNCILGATIETNRFYPEISKAPKPMERIKEMMKLKHMRKIVSIEPILGFDYIPFTRGIRYIEPDFVYVGLDNYNHHLPEPKLAKTRRLIRKLEEFTMVHLKTIRKAWDES